MGMGQSFTISDAKKYVASLFSVPSFGDKPPTLSAARSMTDRYRLSSLLPYRGWDSDYDFMVLDEGTGVSIGYGFEMNPLIMAGGPTEGQIEAVLRNCKAGTTVTFAMLSNDDIHHQVDAWLKKRNGPDNNNPLLRKMAERRAQWMKDSASYQSLNGGPRFYARNVRNFAFFRVPYTGDRKDSREIARHFEVVRENRDQIKGSLSGVGLFPETMNETDTKRLLMQLLNPQFTPETIDQKVVDYEDPVRNLVLKEGMAKVRESDSAIVFTGGDRDCAVSFVTVDRYPSALDIVDTRYLTGMLFDRESNIGERFWLFTNIEVLDTDVVKSQLNFILGKLNQQTLAESAWLRSMLGPLITRRDKTQEMLDMLASGRRLVRMMTGAAIYSEPDRAAINNEYVVGLWRGAGFEASAEDVMGFPMYLCSLPWGYTPAIDSGAKGLQRMTLAHTYNAACACPIASDWRGHGLHIGGPTLFSRRGQISSFDLLVSDTNYNVTIVAESGAGKSFIMNEIITSYLSQGGLVRVIDAGRSYKRIAEITNGENMEFDPRDQKSLNPFYGIANLEDLREEMVMLQELLILMAYPRGEPQDWFAEALAEGIEQSWLKCGGKLGTQEIYEYFVEKGHSDSRAKDLSDQLKPYAIGRYARWFNGPPEISLSNPFTILELDNLNNDKPFRGVIMSLILNMIVRELYVAAKRKTKSGDDVPKLIVVDEAWDLMGKESGKSGKFIETAARRVRKYKGTLATITQGYGDYFASDAATAALNNSAWRFSLRQSGPSMQAAKKYGVISEEDVTTERLMRSVGRGLNYSEVHIRNGSVGEVFRFVCDNFSYYTFTTSPQDKDLIESHIKKGLSITEALEACAKEKDEKDGAERNREKKR